MPITSKSVGWRGGQTDSFIANIGRPIFAIGRALRRANYDRVLQICYRLTRFFSGQHPSQSWAPPGSGLVTDILKNVKNWNVLGKLAEVNPLYE